MAVLSFKLHQFHEFIVTDVPISIEICLLQQLINIFLCHLLSKLLQTLFQFLFSDQSIMVLVEHLKHLLQVISVFLLLAGLTSLGLMYLEMKFRNS